MNFLKQLLVALAPTVLDWGLKQSKILIHELVQWIKYSKKERKIIKRKLKREEITRQIDIATEKGDDEEIKRLYYTQIS